MKFIDSIQFMASSWSTLADNLTERLHKNKDRKSSLEYLTTKDTLLTFKSMECNKSYDKRFDEDLIKRFKNTYRFCGGEINEFCLMFCKGGYPYNYIDSWERFKQKIASISTLHILKPGQK